MSLTGYMNSYIPAQLPEPVCCPHPNAGLTRIPLGDGMVNVVCRCERQWLEMTSPHPTFSRD